MATTWVLIANRANARLFEYHGPKKGLIPVTTLENPQGHQKNREIDSDKHGRSFDSKGSGRHAYSRNVSPTEHVAQQFAKQIAALLHEALAKQAFTRLVLVAEAGFLGMLRKSLDDTIQKTVISSADKDLANVADSDLLGHLDGVL
jgi:protein required for attachment to host cells